MLFLQFDKTPYPGVHQTGSRSIKSETDKDRYYTGIADAVDARLIKHNAGEVSHTSKYKPWRLKTYVAFTDENKAFEFEKYIKSGTRRAFVKKRL